jgi:hypothetical protein
MTPMDRARRAGIGLLTAVALAVPISGALATTADAASYNYQNCTKLNKKFKHGVGKKKARDKVRGATKPVTSFKKSTKIYKKVIKFNRDLDRDRDGVACEKR